MSRRAVRPERGLSLRASTRLEPGRYPFEVGEDEPVITVRADDAVIDCEGVILEAPGRGRMAWQGVALRILSSHRVVVRGLRATRFHVGIHVLHSEDVVIEDVDVSDMRPGGVDGDPASLADPFDKASWRRAGCGVWVEKSRGGALVRCQASRSYGGIALDKAEGTTVLRCDVRDSVAWGLHLDRAVDCHVVSCAAARCGRPSSGGAAAGLFLNNGSHGNRIHSNDLRECATGVLIASERNEQSNDNVVSLNDVSRARVAGLEARCSDRTAFLDNHAFDCATGVLLRNCRESVVSGNSIERSLETGIAALHGQGGAIVANSLVANPVGVRVASDEPGLRPPADWRVGDNLLLANGAAIVLESALRSVLAGNRGRDNGEWVRMDEACHGTEVE